MTYTTFKFDKFVETCFSAWNVSIDDFLELWWVMRVSDVGKVYSLPVWKSYERFLIIVLVYNVHYLLAWCSSEFENLEKLLNLWFSIKQRFS